VSPWFEVYRVADRTFALLEPHHYEEVISYLIVGAERAVLHDTGLGIGDIKSEVAALTDLPILVVNSHSHYDHVGGDWQFADVAVFDDDFEVARVENGIAAPQAATSFLPPGSFTELPAGFEWASYSIRPSPVTQRLHDLDTIDLGGRTLTVHHTPGHSPGSICLMDSQHDLLVTGDTVYPGTLYAQFAESDFAAYRQSLAWLQRLAEETAFLCPAHNEARVSAGLIGEVQFAFDRVANGKVSGRAQGQARIYDFDGFRVATRAVG
jgi:glyoxylase-like metal-dependent hydrolase (beta-lactamase superfamily II)